MEYSTDPHTAYPPPADLDFHPAAALFPLLPVDGPEFGQLVDDIREHGLLQPIVLHEGLILDGRNRYRVCQHAGVGPRFEEWSGESPTAYVLSLNLHRRHLTEGQLAAIAVEAMARFEEEAREAKRRAGVVRASSGPRVEGKFHQLRPNSDEAGDRDHRGERQRRSDERAAKDVGVSRYAVRQAERVKEADPELFEKVRTGVVPLRGAVKEVERRELAPIIKAQVERDRAELKALADEINPPDFDPVENADQVRQRGEFTRLCADLAKLPAPTQFITRHDGKLRPSHVEPARVALAWLTEFVAEWEARS